MELNWNFQRSVEKGGGVLEKIPSMGEVWIFLELTILPPHFFQQTASSCRGQNKGSKCWT